MTFASGLSEKNDTGNSSLSGLEEKGTMWSTIPPDLADESLTSIASKRPPSGKTRAQQVPSTSTKWVSKHIDKKFNSYLEARQHLEGYEDAPIGFSFSKPSADPEFRSAVESAIGKLRKSHPEVTIRLEWPQ
ncbi:hypothetical protein [Actinomadura sp. DC4]|uniref:hypothetical protein n=1 Tax=Actinomadura sp. DC4 TaxID=3055069 RepID=UPI0025B0E56D|nr:hypothetical protein [Actinomadura sp. DC4]MDN3351356.1 hypothetical protein [Actinomadura sp. DC4]